MRKLTSHNNADITIEQVDDLVPVTYEIRVFQNNNWEKLTTIHFQNGPVETAGINGVTDEVLLAIVLDRLLSETGSEEGMAYQHIKEAMHWLHARTMDRAARGVEGRLQQ